MIEESARREKKATDECHLPHDDTAQRYTDKPSYPPNPQIQPPGTPGGKPEGKSDKSTEEHHAQDRADTEDQQKNKPLSHR